MGVAGAGWSERWDSAVRTAAVALGRFGFLGRQVANFADFHALSRSTTLLQVHQVLERGLSQATGHSVMVSLAPNVDVLQARRLAMDQLVLARFHGMRSMYELRVDYWGTRLRQNETVSGAHVEGSGSAVQYASETGSKRDATVLDAPTVRPSTVWYDAHRLTVAAGDALDQYMTDFVEQGHTSEAARAGLPYLVAHESTHPVDVDHDANRTKLARSGVEPLGERIVGDLDQPTRDKAEAETDRRRDIHKRLAFASDQDVIDEVIAAQDGGVAVDPQSIDPSAIRAEHLRRMDRLSTPGDRADEMSVVAAGELIGNHAGYNKREQRAEGYATGLIAGEEADRVSRTTFEWFAQADRHSPSVVRETYLKYDGRMVEANERVLAKTTPEQRTQGVWSGPLPGPTPEPGASGQQRPPAEPAAEPAAGLFAGPSATAPQLASAGRGLGAPAQSLRPDEGAGAAAPTPVSGAAGQAMSNGPQASVSAPPPAPQLSMDKTLRPGK